MFFFIFFKILIFQVVRWVKEQKLVQNNKKLYLSHSISQEPYIIWLSFMVELWKMVIQPFFSFFKVLIFQVVGGIKRQKTVQNDKKFCPLISISQESYILWLSFMVNIYKMIISSDVLFIFLKFWFSGFRRRVKGQKLVENDKKFCQSCSMSQEPYIIWLSYMVHICIKG